MPQLTAGRLADRARCWLPSIVLGAILAYLVIVPLAIMFLSSFRPSGMPLDPGWTLDHYLRTYSDPNFYGMVWTTAQFAAGSALGALSLGILIAWLVERTDLPAKGLVRAMVILPMATPPVLMAMGWVMLLSPRTGFFNTVLISLFDLNKAPINIFSLGGMIFVQSLSLVPSTFLILAPAFRNMDPNLEEAALVSGASLWTMVRRVLLPLLLPAILAAAAFLLIVGFVVFDIPGTIGMPVRIFVLASRIVYLANDAAGGISQYGPISAMALFFLAILLLLAYVYRRATAQVGRFATVTGKNYRPRPFPLRGWRWPALGVVSLYFFLATVAPVAILLWTSLMPYLAPISPDMLAKVTLANHREFFSNQRVVQATQNSLLIALVAATAVALASLLISWVVVRSRAAGRNLLDALSFLPIAIPGVVIGMALVYVYLLLHFTGIYGSIWIIAIAHFTTYLSFGSRATHGVMAQLHQDLEDAARTSGAGWLLLMRRIVGPLTLPASLGVWVWVIAHSLRDLSSALLLQGGDNRTLPVLLWNYWSGGEPNKAAAVGVWLVVAMLVVVSAWQIVNRPDRAAARNG